MRAHAVPSWLFWSWIGLILFSQTGLAGRMVDALLSMLFEPGPDSGGWLRFVAQKGYHVALFGGMGALLGMRSKPASRAAMLGWCVGFSAFAEALQTLADNRNPSPWDALLNITAALGFYALTGRVNGRDSRPGSSAPHPR